ncbi:unnamed protein product [Boreogadus saida]
MAAQLEGILERRKKQKHSGTGQAHIGSKAHRDDASTCNVLEPLKSKVRGGFGSAETCSPAQCSVGSSSSPFITHLSPLKMDVCVAVLLLASHP